MAEQKSDNARLETLAEEFAKDRQKEKYAEVMEALEKSTVLMPVMPPRGLDEETQRAMKAGKPVRLPKNASITPCLLRKESGEQLLPVFTSGAQIPPEKKSPAVLAMPFQVCLSMVTANSGQVSAMVLNPFTHNIAMPKEILEVARRRMEAAKQTKTVRVTEKQFARLAHDRVAFQLLPRYLFEHKEDGLRRLQDEEGAFLLELYRECYPEERRQAAAVTEEDFSVMTMNVTEDMQITRVDMPEGRDRAGSCYRVYAVFLRGARQIRCYTLERTEQGNQIGRVGPDGVHETLEPAPDNGAEIEAVMALAARAQE